MSTRPSTLGRRCADNPKADHADHDQRQYGSPTAVNTPLTKPGTRIARRMRTRRAMIIVTLRCVSSQAALTKRCCSCLTRLSGEARQPPTRPRLADHDRQALAEHALQGLVCGGRSMVSRSVYPVMKTIGASETSRSHLAAWTPSWPAWRSTFISTTSS